MELRKVGSLILQEIGDVLSGLDEAEVDSFIKAILDADKVFVIGVGRVMFMAQAFAKRLRHLGIRSYVVGETTIPPISGNDLLVACSGSGETMTTLNIARLARQHGARIAAITAHKESNLGRIADCVVALRCPTKLHRPDEVKSVQPMGSLYEQSLLIFFDSVSMKLKERFGITEEQMWAAHANLE
ncbi:MAG: 6-phospho-3-hexuloisomerase [Firmicutes bacterium]|nr:6-phospho-3-hexuloisomerase [Bacillota bacterium]